jgi:hypothetical protein
VCAIAGAFEAQAMIYILVIIVVVFAVGFLVLLGSTAKAVREPNQIELAGLMLAIIAETNKKRELLDPPARTFIIAWYDVREFLDNRYPMLSDGQRQTKLVHALLTIKPMLDQWDYKRLYGFCRDYRR